MINAPGFIGVAFSERSDGDIRNDVAARGAVAAQLGVSEDWAEVSQVHGDRVVRVSAPGKSGEADALWTTESGLPLAIFTADCYGVAILADHAVGVAHAGWRGAASGVVPRLREEMSASGHHPSRAAVGPGIGSCCFEVGPEVAEVFTDGAAKTSWGTTSVDLPAVLAGQLGGLETWMADGCTRHEPGWFSHRADGTRERLASIVWLS